MVRPALVAGTVALAFASTTLATPPQQPSDRACLIAWNSPTNRANHVRLLAQRPIAGLMLRPAVVGTVTFKKGSTPKQSGPKPACVLTIEKQGSLRNVTGVWNAGVAAWSFGRRLSTNRQLPPNVRLLTDGRVTKIYLR